jgi:hypothetical protein
MRFIKVLVSSILVLAVLMGISMVNLNTSGGMGMVLSPRGMATFINQTGGGGAAAARRAVQRGRDAIQQVGSIIDVAGSLAQKKLGVDVRHQNGGASVASAAAEPSSSSSPSSSSTSSQGGRGGGGGGGDGGGGGGEGVGWGGNHFRSDFPEKEVEGQALVFSKGGSGNSSRILKQHHGVGGVEGLRKCHEMMQAVERALFLNMSWDAAERAARASPPGECGNALRTWADCGGDRAWQKGGNKDNAARFKSSGRAKVTLYTNNGTTSRLTRDIDHPTVAWLGDLSVSKGKRMWKIGIMGDSTMRGLTKAFGELFLGPNLSIIGGLARLFETIQLDVQAEDDLFKLVVYFQKNWMVTFANEARRLSNTIDSMDVFAWNVGQHAMWAPIAKAKAMRRPSMLIQGGFFARESAKLDKLLPPWTRLVYVNTNSLCPNHASDAAYKLQNTTPSEASVGYLFTREGGGQMNARQAR